MASAGLREVQRSGRGGLAMLGFLRAVLLGVLGVLVFILLMKLSEDWLAR